MRRLSLATALVIVLVGTGVAFAHALDFKSIVGVGASFTATSASNVSTETCTGADGAYTKTHGTYSGTATSSDPALNGPITIDANSIFNQSSNVGLVTGTIHLTGTGSDLSASFTTVLASNATIAGLAQGWEHGPSHQLIANVSAGFTSTAGFTNGLLGANTGPGGAVEVTPGDCQRVSPPRPDKIGVHAYVTAVSSMSITAGGVTCAVPANFQAAVANIHVGDRVEMHCLGGNPNTLYRLSTDEHHR